MSDFDKNYLMPQNKGQNTYTGFEDIPMSFISAYLDKNDEKLDWATNQLAKTSPTICASHNRQLVGVELFIFFCSLFYGFSILFPILTTYIISICCLLMVLNEVLCLLRPTLTGSFESTLRPRELPTYSALLPLYDEAHMVPQLAQAMSDFNYPTNKFEVIFIVEEQDLATQNSIKAYLKQNKLRVASQLIIVPDADLRTKPRACNYALTFACGENIVVYDAEDKPHPDQLLEAAHHFVQDGTAKVCFQAPLIIKDKKYDLLGGFMALNYTTQFCFQMPSLAQIGMPIFFGGTSNHIRKRDLINNDGWDAYNVTEDAELSLRIAKRGFQIKMLKSPTFETATRGFKNHFTQRSRWQKGSFQTLIAHLGTTPISALNSFQSTYVYLSLVNRIISPILYLALFTHIILHGGIFMVYNTVVGKLILGSFSLLFLFNTIGCLKSHRYGLLWLIPLLPMHWMFLSVTFLYAIDQLLNDPTNWDKTNHTRWND